MIRPIAGLVALNALFLLAGYGLLFGLGLVRTRGEALRLAGLATALGFAVVCVTISVGLVLGGSAGIAEAAIAAIVCGVAGGLAGRVIPPRHLRRESFSLSRLDRVAVLASFAALVVYAGALLARALLSDGPLYWDPWWFWLPKARTLMLDGGLDAGPGGFTSWANPDYPPLVPGFDAVVLEFVGGVDLRWLAVELWTLDVAFVAGAAALLAPRVAPAVLWPLLTLVTLLPGYRYLVGSFLADELLTIEFALAALAAALWVVDRDPRWPALCALFLTAAVVTKNEGLLLYFVLVPLVVVLTAARRTLVPLAALAALPVLALLPWKLWLRANDVPPTPAFDPADLLDPASLVDRGERLRSASAEIGGILIDPEQWLILMPIVVVAGLLALPIVPRVALLELGLVGLGFSAIVAVYWASPYGLEYAINTSASRVVAPVAVASAVILPIIVAAAIAPRPATPARAPAPAPRR